MSNIFFPNYSGYVVTSKFGMRIHPVSGVKKMHNGIDINASNDGKTGQVDDIMAHTGGIVEAADYDASAGNFIKIKVSSDSYMVYYHMKAQSAYKKNDVVKQGDVLGRVGKTGTATGPHLHWGIERAGEWIDPTPYLDADYIQKCNTIILCRGIKGQAVKELQEALIELGYDVGDTGADSSYGGKTEAAVKKFQHDHFVEATGLFDENTNTLLQKALTARHAEPEVVVEVEKAQASEANTVAHSIISLLKVLIERLKKLFSKNKK